MGMTPATIAMPPAQSAIIPPMRTMLVRVLAAAFLVSLFVPLVGALRDWDFAGAANENRRLAERPPLPDTFKDAGHYADRWLGFYRDHFGFRNTLIQAVAETRFHGFGTDSNESYIAGKDGWLFFRPEGDRNFMGFRGLNPLSDQELTAWQDLIENRRAFLAARGIAYLVVIPPDKQTVYPEYLPAEYAPVREETHLDQLVARLRETNSSVHLIDLRPILNEAKKRNRIYFKTDTHWNDYGGYAAYSVILDAVNKALGVKMIPQPLGDFVPRSTIHSGDLSHLTNLYYEYDEDWPELIRRTPFPTIVNPEDPYLPVITKGSDPHAPSLYMLHDSYTLYLSQFLGPHFSRVCWDWNTTMNGQRVLAFKPDIVIDEFLERMMYGTAPVDSADIRAARGK
jgi:alginate O-acetyltransferase complex protein AlgJ